MNCSICDGPLVNIETGISRYFTYICVNQNCSERGKVQIHKDTMSDEFHTGCVKCNGQLDGNGNCSNYCSDFEPEQNNEVDKFRSYYTRKG